MPSEARSSGRIAVAENHVESDKTTALAESESAVHLFEIRTHIPSGAIIRFRQCRSH